MGRADTYVCKRLADISRFRAINEVARHSARTTETQLPKLVAFLAATLLTYPIRPRFKLYRIQRKRVGGGGSKRSRFKAKSRGNLFRIDPRFENCTSVLNTVGTVRYRNAMQRNGRVGNATKRNERQISSLPLNSVAGDSLNSYSRATLHGTDDTVDFIRQSLCVRTYVHGSSIEQCSHPASCMAAKRKEGQSGGGI